MPTPSTPVSRLTTLLTAAVMTLALAFGAGTANAQPNTGGGPAPKSCVDADGNTHPDGSILKVYIKVGKKRRVAYIYKCVNGSWESVPY